MEEFKLYIQTLKSIADRYYGKECVFYDDGVWYSREHCRNLSPEELIEYILKITKPVEYDD